MDSNIIYTVADGDVLDDLPELNSIVESYFDSGDRDISEGWLINL